MMALEQCAGLNQRARILRGRRMKIAMRNKKSYDVTGGLYKVLGGGNKAYRRFRLAYNLV